MKKIFVLLFCLFVCGYVNAQTNLNKDLTFVYISHDENTPTQALISRLKEIYTDAMNYPEDRAAIFYLTNGDNPIVVKMNVKNSNPKDFESLVEDLQSKRAHDVFPETDCEKILEVFAENDLVDEKGEPLFRSVEWNYYVNSTFWKLNNNEYVIAALYWALEMEKMIESQYLQIRILHGEVDPLPVNKDFPFGTKGFCRKMPFLPLPY
ncbi:MAG: hypothetical protein IJB87_00850 [Alistipes sp.]|nr:hypothetical protein [Alistipes sp.]